MRSAYRLEAGRDVIDRDARDQFGSAIARPPIGINDHGSLSGKSAQDAALNGVDDGPDSFGVIVSGQAHEDVHFADVDQLAKKIIRKKALLCQFHLRAKYRRMSLCRRASCDIVFTDYICSDSSQPKPVKLVGPHR